VLAADLVTADGQLRHLSEDENPDLFWAIRGGGGNFGVATSFTYRLHPFDPTIFGGAIIYPFDQAKDALLFYAEYTESLPDAANVEPIGTTSPDGNKVLVVEVAYIGDHKEAENVFAPLRAFGKPVFDDIGPLSYQELQTRYDGIMGHGAQNYLKSGFIPELTPAAIDAMVDNFDSEKVSMMWFQHLGGQIGRIAPDATAFAHRNVHSNFGIQGFWTEPSEDEQRIAAVRKYYSAMEPHMGGFYTNLNDDTEQKTWGNYGKNYPRLARIKSEFDPENLFRLNANIRPAAS
jgi:FAD/FMN-containing dehydrogenase